MLGYFVSGVVVRPGLRYSGPASQSGTNRKFILQKARLQTSLSTSVASHLSLNLLVDRKISFSMSRFFTAGDSSSESSSDEEELYSGDEAAQKDGEDSSSAEEDSDEEDEESSSEEEGGGGVGRFLRDAASSAGESSDEDTPKVVKSAKNKRLEELEGIIKLIDNAIKINDWSSISTGRLCKGDFC